MVHRELEEQLKLFLKKSEELMRVGLNMSHLVTKLIERINAIFIILQLVREEMLLTHQDIAWRLKEYRDPTIAYQFFVIITAIYFGITNVGLQVLEYLKIMNVEFGAFANVAEEEVKEGEKTRQKLALDLRMSMKKIIQGISVLTQRLNSPQAKPGKE